MRPDGRAYPAPRDPVRSALVLENRKKRGAFSAVSSDSLASIAGPLAVSLENALLYERLEQRVAEQTSELREAQEQLVAAARRAGMAEIATNVLHNVGNILNSVNVAAEMVRSRAAPCRASATGSSERCSRPGLPKAAGRAGRLRRSPPPE